MGGEVQHFALLSLARREHIFDVLEMSTRSKVKEESGESNEGDLEELGPRISRILGMREGVGAAYQREARKSIIDAQTTHAPS